MPTITIDETGAHKRKRRTSPPPPKPENIATLIYNSATVRASLDRPIAWLGVDPGGSGAIAAVFQQGHPIWIKLDNTDGDVSDWLHDLASEYRIVGAVLERVGSMPGQGVSSSFKFGASSGFCRGLLVAHRIAFRLVGPVQWQNAMTCRTKGDKNVTKTMAQRIWPSIKITHGNADALLIAEFCRRTTI
jgi:Holliday junction resolvasome RuvABC endonuclease subunit